jgi:hypothetical protein
MDSFIISTDASKVGIGAVLSQVGHDGVECPIFICSRTTSPAESRYATTALECLAVVYYIEVFKFYVGGSTLKVRTDHRALQWLFSSKRTSMYLRWILRLQPYNFEVEYRPGKFNHVPDAVSRSPTPTDPNEIYNPVEPLFLSIARAVAPEDLGLSTCTCLWPERSPVTSSTLYESTHCKAASCARPGLLPPVGDA